MEKTKDKRTRAGFAEVKNAIPVKRSADGKRKTGINVSMNIKTV